MAIDEARMTPDELKAYGTAKKKGRYGNVAKRTEYKGIKYDSQLEASYACELDVEQQQGRIRWVLRQVAIPLGPDFRTRVDFVVGERLCEYDYLAKVTAHEVKGVETREFAKVRKLWPKYGPFDLIVIKRGEVEIIEGKK